MIEDPEVVLFLNEVVRPMAEEIRAIVARIESAKTKWFSGLNGKTLNTDDVVDDGRESEGVSRITGADINSFMNVIINIEGASNDEIVSKPTVRPLSAS